MTGLTVVLLMGAPAAQNQPSIQLGGIQLTLGMPQEEALRRLGVVYAVRHIDASPGSWGITSKEGPPFTFFGTVGFTNDRLTYVSKMWGPNPYDQSARALATAILDAVRSVASKSVSCAPSVDNPGTNYQASILQCGRYRLAIHAPTNADTAPSVVEVLR